MAKNISAPVRLQPEFVCGQYSRILRASKGQNSSLSERPGPQGARRYLYCAEADISPELLLRIKMAFGDWERQIDVSFQECSKDEADVIIRCENAAEAEVRRRIAEFLEQAMRACSDVDLRSVKSQDLPEIFKSLSPSLEPEIAKLYRKWSDCIADDRWHFVIDQEIVAFFKVASGQRVGAGHEAWQQSFCHSAGHLLELRHVPEANQVMSLFSSVAVTALQIHDVEAARRLIPPAARPRS